MNLIKAIVEFAWKALKAYAMYAPETDHNTSLEELTK